MFKNKITNHSNEPKTTLSNGSRHKFVKGLCLAALVLLLSEIASATTLESQLDKIAASCSPKGYKRSVLGAIAASIGVILVLYQQWRTIYGKPPTTDNAKQTNQPKKIETQKVNKGINKHNNN